MNINGVNYESYLAAIAQVQASSTQQTDAQTSKEESNRDSYISSLVSSDMAIPSGTYSANGTELETFLPVTDTNTDSETSTVQDTAVSGSAGSAGGAGGGSSDSEEDTETEIVTIDGVTYLQTTTTDENGNTTVTKTRIGGSPENDDKSVNTASNSVQLS